MKGTCYEVVRAGWQGHKKGPLGVRDPCDYVKNLDRLLVGCCKVCACEVEARPSRFVVVGTFNYLWAGRVTSMTWLGRQRPSPRQTPGLPIECRGQVVSEGAYG